MPRAVQLDLADDLDVGAQLCAYPAADERVVVDEDNRHLRHYRLRCAVSATSVPVGAGLSSSAALEVSAGLALASVSGAEVSRVGLALAGQRAEHEWVGANVGIMDQFVAALARAGHAL